MARWRAGGGHRTLAWEQIRDAFRIEITRRVDKTGKVRWEGDRWIVPEGLLQARVQLRLDPHQPHVIDVWYQGQYYGPAVRANTVVPEAPAPPGPAGTGPPGPGLSYLTILADRQAARRQPGIRYDARHQEEEPT